MATAIIGIIVLSVILLIIRQLYTDKKRGKSVCGCKCSGCPNASVCHKVESKGNVLS
ncbi:MAG: FeoB-associated Cys-rich membrane protein [Ruminococcus sp.]|nr:FeoB-associated Cys-rich membrane protein [Ruminococcus sp.]